MHAWTGIAAYTTFVDIIYHRLDMTHGQLATALVHDFVRSSGSVGLKKKEANPCCDWALER
jgi:hypothetical protein